MFHFIIKCSFGWEMFFVRLTEWEKSHPRSVSPSRPLVTVLFWVSQLNGGSEEHRRCVFALRFPGSFQMRESHMGTTNCVNKPWQLINGRRLHVQSQHDFPLPRWFIQNGPINPVLTVVTYTRKETGLWTAQRTNFCPLDALKDHVRNLTVTFSLDKSFNLHNLNINWTTRCPCSEMLLKDLLKSYSLQVLVQDSEENNEETFLLLRGL